MLGAPPDGAGATPFASQLRALIATLVERLEEHDDGATAAEHAAHEAQLARVRRRYASRIDAMDRVSVAIARLREIMSPGTMLQAAPKALCEGSRLDRVLLSAIRDGSMVAEAAHFGDDRTAAGAALEALRARPVPLEHALIETEVPGPAPLDSIGSPPGADDGAALAGVLASRELEVLELLSEGRTNRSIADELVISSGTVKFHVNSILRKLRVGNRVEAVARYYALLRKPPRGP